VRFYERIKAKEEGSSVVAVTAASAVEDALHSLLGGY